MAPRRVPAVQVVEDATLERLVARAVSKVGPLGPPWIVSGLGVAAGAGCHGLWGGPGPGAAWAASGLTAGTAILTGLTWQISHERRGLLGRVHTTLTTVLAGGWVTAATITGVTAPITGSVALIGGATLALSWNLRHVIRAATDESGHIDGLQALFGQARDAVGLDGTRARTTHSGDHKVVGALALPPGETVAEDVQKKTAYLESGMGLPPGSVTVSGDIDRADRAHITVSDPRVMRASICWPGPSRPGGSITDPVRPGLWQDLDPVAYTIVGHHLQVMGMTSSGKSFGGAWNLLGEVITRTDVAVLAIDITKGNQTLGPLRKALHRFETNPGGARALITQVRDLIEPRTDALAAQGLQRWAPGCGFSYLVLWLEEFPDIGDALEDMGEFLKILKAARSAGISVVMSLQRSDWTQMPTLARGQLAKMCFGVADSGDADFGLTERQTKAGAHPEQWQNTQPGMAYLDAPSIPEDRIAMPLRTYTWVPARAQALPDEDQQKAAAAEMRALAQAWPATRVRPDQFLTTLTGQGVPDGTPVPHQADPTDRTELQEEGEDMVGDPLGEYLLTPDPDPANTAGADDPITDTGYENFTFTPLPVPDPPLTPDEARRALRDQIATWTRSGRETFAVRDLRPLLDRIGRSRQWAQKEIRALIDSGLIDPYDETIPGYRLTTPQPA